MLGCVCYEIKEGNGVDNVLYIVENINVAAIETTLWSIVWPFLQAVIKETLRLRMAIPLMVPPRRKVLVNAWWLANNPAQWKNPEEFRPESSWKRRRKLRPTAMTLDTFHSA
ncbi:hypothetical protein LIER_05220 [Lithospermum erythrorhizon]|uniref:Uncharacterized protein n=1 Tax=Lithospermum erythrorhizon TaxID=34254 RepID=A0AAV3P124_LITER